jgi:type I restriction enzyme, S subunit
MNAEQVLQHFERISEAPDALPRLRRFILDLAVRGKLVEQALSDEKPKCIKRQDESAAPFNLPSNWKWIQIGDQLNLLNGMAFKSTDWGTTGLRIVRIQNLNNINAAFNFCDPVIARERSLIDDGSFLISWSGTPGTSFGAFIWERGPAVLNQHIFRCDFKTQSFIASFLRLAINGRLDEMISKAHGGAGLQHITKGKLEALLIPLPPLAEQHRIVAKVEELMNLCDQLEAAKAEREQCRDNLVAASLQGLNQPAEEEDTFREHARFTFNNLPRITTRTVHIKQLRQTILNLAVRGKLLEGKSCQAASVGDYRSLQNGYAFKSSWFSKSGIRLLRNANIGHDEIRWTDVVHIPEERVPEFERFRLNEGDIVLTLDRPFITTGTKVARIGANDLPSLLLQRVGKFVETSPGLDDDYLFIWINSPHFNEQIDPGRSNGVPHISSKQVAAAKIFVPPLAEQQRIVAKVDELMAICDQLEAQITVTEQDSRRFLESVLADALASGIDLSAETQVA